MFLIIEKFLNFHKFGYNILSNIFICFVIFNLWVVFRITDFEKMIDFFNIFYIQLSDFINKEVLITLISVFVLILSQKLEQHKILNSFSSKISFSFLMPLFLAILIVGISISLGQSEKFIFSILKILFFDMIFNYSKPCISVFQTTAREMTTIISVLYFY